ncbi:MAG TPA: hypothetical protein VJ927_10435, partial [Actinomycetota bacterium]|nr:hypothetical protein [Actinomycetota bacterium]
NPPTDPGNGNGNPPTDPGPPSDPGNGNPPTDPGNGNGNPPTDPGPPSDPGNGNGNPPTDPGNGSGNNGNGNGNNGNGNGNSGDDVPPVDAGSSVTPDGNQNEGGTTTDVVIPNLDAAIGDTQTAGPGPPPAFVPVIVPPVETGSDPVETGSDPVETGSDPVETGSGSLEPELANRPSGPAHDGPSPSHSQAGGAHGSGPNPALATGTGETTAPALDLLLPELPAAGIQNHVEGLTLSAAAPNTSGRSGDDGTAGSDLISKLQGLLSVELQNAADVTATLAGGAKKAAAAAVDGLRKGAELTLGMVTAEAFRTGKTYAFPLALAGLVVAFLLFQWLIDRRDPKLALALIKAEEELIYE